MQIDLYYCVLLCKEEAREHTFEIQTTRPAKYFKHQYISGTDKSCYETWSSVCVCSLRTYSLQESLRPRFSK